MHMTAETALEPRAQSTRPATERAARRWSRPVEQPTTEPSRHHYSGADMGLAFAAGAVLTTCAALPFVQFAL